MKWAILILVTLIVGLTGVMALGFISEDLRTIPMDQYRIQNCKTYGTHAFCDVAFQNGKISSMYMGKFNVTPTLTQIRTINDLKIQKIVTTRINSANRPPSATNTRIITGNP